MFGDIVDREIHLNDAGIMVRNVWRKIREHFPYADIDEFIVMPNHVHGIIVMVGAQFIAPFQLIAPCGNNRDVINQNKKHGAMKQGAINHAPTVGEIVRAFKARCTYAINQICNTMGHPVWQRNYYEHVIRSEEKMNRIHKYIVENPAKWDKDENNPININRRGLINQTPTNTPPTNIS